MRPFLFIFLLFLYNHSTGQIITTIAGNGTYGYSGNGGLATSARLGGPHSVVSDNNGNIYITDADNNVIRKVNSAGIITNFAGTGTLGYSGDGGPAIAAKLYHPGAIALDNAGNIYFDDQNGNVIRKISTSGIISSITGNLPAGYSGDGGLLISARFNGISNITFDVSGNMFLSDFGNNVIRKVNTSGIVMTIAGNGTAGFSGDGGLATLAKLDAPYGVIALNTGEILISDARNNRIRIINIAGIINTYAGTGQIGYSGDGGAATSATFHFPTYSTSDNLGNIYITDPLNWVVRKIDKAGIITTFAGNGTQGYSGDGGPPTLAQMVDVCGVDFDENNGSLYIVNRNLADVVRKVTTCLSANISQQPANVNSCNSGNATFSIVASNALNYQWQLNTGTGWTNLTNNLIYSGTATNTLVVSSATITMNNFQYRCIVSNGCGSVYSISALLLINMPPTPSIIITASSPTICKGASVVFTATALNGGSSPVYQWKKNGINVGTNSSSYTDNSLVNGNVISCTLTSNATCITGNSANSNLVGIVVTTPVTPTIAVLASANNICSGTPVTFTSSITNGGAAPIFAWFKNGVNLSLNSPTYTDNTLKNGDIIVCTVTSNLACVTSSVVTSSSITMSIIPVVPLSITISTSTNSVCRNTSVLFTASSVNGGNIPFYQWKKNGNLVGSNTINYTDNSLINGDVITCTITSSNNCITPILATSNLLSIKINPDPVVSLDKNPTLCEEGNRILDAGSFSSYLWNTGSTDSKISISKPGLYSVTVTDINGCIATDFTNITTLFPSPKAFLLNDTSICSYGSLLLKPNSIFQSYLWNTGSTNFSINIIQPGQYWLQVKNNEGCTGIDTMMVRPKECLQGFFMPTAFTPNNDGNNDVMKPILLGNVKEYRFSIYNRWGQLIFQTTDLSQSWNGNYKGETQNENVFVWMCTYQFGNEPVQNKKGTFVLIR